MQFCTSQTSCHIGIAGNELADELEKASLSDKKIKDMKIPYSDYKITEHFDGKWQANWNEEISNKLYKIQQKPKKHTNP